MNKKETNDTKNCSKKHTDSRTQTAVQNNTAKQRTTWKVAFMRTFLTR